MNDTADESRDRKSSLVGVAKVIGAIGLIVAGLFTYLGELDTNDVKRLDAQKQLTRMFHKSLFHPLGMTCRAIL